MAQPATSSQDWSDSGRDGADADADLVARSLQGHQDAFEVLFDRYARQVYNIAYRISSSPTEAEDLTQDIFLRAFRTLGTLRQPRAFAAWLYQMATNVCLDALRRRRAPQAELSDAVIATFPDEARWRSPEAVALATDDQRDVWEALARLAPSQRTALALRELYGMNYGEIAATLGTSVGAVEVLIFRARRRFREQYAKVAAGARPPEQVVRCGEARASLAAILDEEGASKDRASALAHVRGCPTCQAEIAAQRSAGRKRALLPLLPLPLALKGHLLSQLSPLIEASTVGTGATASTGATAAPAGTATGVAAGTAEAGAVTGAAKIVAILAPKVLLIAAGLTTAAVVAVPLLHRQHTPVRKTVAVGPVRSSPTSIPPPSISLPIVAVATPVKRTAISSAAHPLATSTPPSIPPFVAVLAPARPASLSHGTARSAGHRNAGARSPRSTTPTTRRLPRRGASNRVSVHRYTPAHKQQAHKQLTRKHVHARRTTPRPTLRRTQQPIHRSAARPSLAVTWPAGRVLHFDRRETLRLHTLADASVVVTLRIVRLAGAGEGHSLGSHGQKVYRFVMRGRTDGLGNALIPLRYAYVPTQPTPLTVAITIHAGRHTIQRGVGMTLVRQ